MKLPVLLACAIAGAVWLGPAETQAQTSQPPAASPQSCQSQCETRVGSNCKSLPDGPNKMQCNRDLSACFTNCIAK